MQDFDNFDLFGMREDSESEIETVDAEFDLDEDYGGLFADIDWSACRGWSDRVY